MKKISLLITAVLFLSVAALAQKNKIKYVEYDLPNGLHVILHEDHSTPIVAVTMMYHVGSKNEDPKRTGFAHFFEHLLFEGSENIGRGEFDKYIENAGGTMNANTTNDRTFYYEILPSNQLELGLWLESERLMHAKIEDIGIETQREVVKEEKRQRVDNQPYGTILYEVMRRAYTTHPYQWTTIGSMEHIDAATRQEFMDFYKTYYVPNNAVLSIAGDIDVKKTKSLIKAYFGPIKKGAKVPEVTAVEPPQTKEIRDVIYDNIQLPAVVQTYHIPAQGTPDFYAVDMMGRILSNGESSRMNKELVDKQQKAIAAGSFPFPLEDPGVNIVFAFCNMGVQPDEVEKLMDAEVEKLKNELISETEFQKLRNQVENDFISGNSTVAGIAEQLANYHMYFGDAALINEEIKRYNKVTREDIQRVAKKYFTTENRVVLHYMPKPAEDNK